jgi:DNA mismatch endonuclease, patch repair protein
MADIVDPFTRSRMMASIKGSNTGPEIALRKALHALGLRYRLHDRKLPGRPDIVLPRWKAVVFVHGCFWHRHEGCRYATVPATRPEFWNTKFRENVFRDQRNLASLAEAEWRTCIVWECDLRTHGASVMAVDVLRWLRSEI